MSDGRDELGRWVPGRSGNPYGRPRGAVGLTTTIREELERLADDGRTFREMLAERVVAMALAGDIRAIAFVADRVEGKPRESEREDDGEEVVFPTLDPKAR